MPILQKLAKIGQNSNNNKMDKISQKCQKLYLGNTNSYPRPAGVKTTGLLRAFQLPAWVTQPKRPKGTKDEVKRSKGPRRRGLEGL